jgi:16S rRNA (cytosine967-C5)-methyltransferase
MAQSARGVALRALFEWRMGKRFADSIIQQLLAGDSLSASDRAFATELFYGVLRNLTLLDFWIECLRSVSLERDSRDLLRLGLYQLFFLHTPAHAAIYEMVELASRKNHALINGVLRTAHRKFTDLETAARAAPIATRFSHPKFLIERWTKQYGADAAIALCERNNQPAPVYARINRLKISVEEFVTKYPTTQALPERTNFVRLNGIPAEALLRGECYIQDPSTSLACELLDPQPGETVLDACAAPGGKGSLIAELMQDRGELIACDRDPDRVSLLQNNLATLGITCARTMRHDWKAESSPELAANSFDRILLDAPCSNSGVMRRRVDVRWRLRPEDFVRMPDEQLAILRATIPLLKPGGTLVYSTCSIEREENEDVAARAVSEFPFLRLTEQKSILPFRDQFDGAFAARLERVA